MSILGLLKIALSQLKSNKLRSFLTTLGIVLGVWFVISIATVIESFSATMLDATQGLGSDTFQVDRFPRSRNRTQQREAYPRIKPSAAKRINERCPHVKIAAAEDGKSRVSVSFLDRETNSTFYLYAAQPGFQGNNNWPIDKGREINTADNLSTRNVIVLGHDAVKELFFDREPIGQIVKLDGRNYRVVGTMEDMGNFMGQNRNTQIAIPFSTFRSIYGDRKVRITVSATSIFDREKAIEEVRNEMRLINKVEPGAEDSFGIWTNESSSKDMLSFFGNVKQYGSLLGLLALFVGGIGVMNIMLASVKERTREIGVRKSLGARKTTVLYQFLFESSTLCIFGCAIGIAFGFLTGSIISMLLNTSVSIPTFDMALAVIGTSFIGIVFGSFPAWKAAQLDPIEALRYE